MTAKLGEGHFGFGVGELWAWSAALSFAAVDVMLRAAAPQVDPWLASLLTLLPLAAVAWFRLAHGSFGALRPGHSEYLGARLIGALLLGGAIGYVVGNFFFFTALADGGLAISVNALQGGNVWGGAILGALILRERPRTEQLVGGLIIVAGLTIIAVSRLDTPGDMWFAGLLMAVAAGICYASTNVATRLVQRRRAALAAVLACTAAGGLVPLSILLAFRAVAEPTTLFDGLQGRDVVVVLGSGVVSILAMVSVGQAVRHVSVATVNAIGSSAVVFTLLASIVLFNEAAPALMFVGVAGVLVGILVGQAKGRTMVPAGEEPASVLGGVVDLDG